MERIEVKQVDKIVLRVPISREVIPPAMVWPVRSILQWIYEIKHELENPYNTADMDAIVQRIAKLAAQYSSSVDALASAKWYLAQAQAESFDYVWKRIKAQDSEIMRELRGVASSQNVKAYIQNRCADLVWLETSTERLNSAITHNVDALRSILSKGKVDMQINAYAQQVQSDGRNEY